MRLTALPDPLAICRLAPDAEVPEWAQGELTSVTRTPGELSIVCVAAAVPESLPEHAKVEAGWRAFAVAGPLDFSLTGVLASITTPLAAAEVSVFALCTYDTDYVLVREADFERAAEALRSAGHELA